AAETARHAGASVLIGGERRGPAAYAPTVLDEVDRASELAREEAFAPLVLLMPYTTFDDAIALANATPYGLNAGIFTSDLREALAAARD
ncbi:aldehyde dehydrogenase family protein, partial [Mesorhizobium sp. M1A.T.Ca.IN.004.03.1.1]|uniref:aldehyde dehydrogenase family protein n=1 Tax=Mesorhizobium sp. M1A.T.Ca.IN.004.03.1.1 TaxID=2496795 RepID=UPI000FCCB1AB